MHEPKRFEEVTNGASLALTRAKPEAEMESLALTARGVGI
jgi:hypothetical protein